MTISVMNYKDCLFVKEAFGFLVTGNNFAFRIVFKLVCYLKLSHCLIKGSYRLRNTVLFNPLFDARYQLKPRHCEIE